MTEVMNNVMKLSIERCGFSLDALGWENDHIFVLVGRHLARRAEKHGREYNKLYYHSSAHFFAFWSASSLSLIAARALRLPPNFGPFGPTSPGFPVGIFG